LNIARGLLTDIQKSPYRDRIFVVLDSVHSASLPDQISAMGVPKENIVTWPKNGIENYYPPSILDKIFGSGPDIEIKADVIVRNGVSYTKGELVDKVIGSLQCDTPMHPDFNKMLLEPLERTLGLPIHPAAPL
jgi:hypothetical protein